MCEPYLEDLRLSKRVFKKMTPFAQAMPERYRHPNVVTAYRAYYLGEKRHLAKWTNRKVPYWWE